MKKLFLVAFAALFFACDVDVYYTKMPDDAEVGTAPRFDEYVAAFAAERAAIPSFVCETVAADVAVAALPEADWQTVRAPRFGSRNAKQGGEIFYRLTEFPATFRYCGPNSTAETQQLFWTSMPLLDVSPYDYSFMPSAATAWSFAGDGRTVYYKLNENARWSDGSPCTADDFCFAVEFYTSQEIVDPWFNAEYATLTVKKITDYCIAVSYEHNGNLSEMELLSATNLKPVCKSFYNGVVPKNWVYDYNNAIEPTTAPYILSEYDMNKGLRFSKVKNWWGYEYEHYQGMSNFDAVNYFLTLGKTSAAMNHFKAGKFDILELDGSQEFLAALSEACVTEGFVTPWRTKYTPRIGMCGFFFNAADVLLSSATIREGLFYALDIAGIGGTSYAANLTQLNTLGHGEVFAGVDFNNEAIETVAFDAKKANEIFDGTEFNEFTNDGIRKNKKGKKLRVEILYAQALPKYILGFLNEQAKKAGVELSFRYLRDGDVELVSQGKFQIYFADFRGTSLPNHYYDFHSSFAKTGDMNNICALQDNELDKMLETYNDGNLPLVELATLNKKIERQVMKDFVFIPFYYSSVKSFLTWKWICFPGWINQPHDENFARTMFSYAWFDQGIYDEVIKARTDKKVLPQYAFDGTD